MTRAKSSQSSASKKFYKTYQSYKKLNGTYANISKEVNSLTKQISDLREKYKYQMKFPSVNWTRYDKRAKVYSDITNEYRLANVTMSRVRVGSRYYNAISGRIEFKNRQWGTTCTGISTK